MKKLTHSLTFATIAFLFIVFPQLGTAYEVPASTGFVNDFADILSPEKEQALETQLVATSNTSEAEVRIVTISSLNGEDPQTVANQFFKAWEIGQKDRRGVMILVAVDDQELRLLSSDQPEPAISDSFKDRVISRQIAPAFNSTNYEDGIQAGVNSILLYLDDPENIIVQNDDGTTAPAFNAVFRTFSLLVLIYSVMIMVTIGLVASTTWLVQNTKIWWLGAALAGVLGYSLGSFSAAGSVTGLLFFVVGILYSYLVHTKQLRRFLDVR